MTTAPFLNSIEVLPMRGSDAAHNTVLAKVLEQCIGKEAKQYGAIFQKERFGFVIDAIRRGELSANFLILKLNNDPVGQVCGVSIQFPTVYTEWNPETKAFVFYNAEYFEDMVVSPKFSSLVKAGAESFKIPGRSGLGTYFTCSNVHSIATPGATIESLDREKTCINSAKAFICEYPNPKHLPLPAGVLAKFNATKNERPENYVYTFPDINTLTRGSFNSLPISTLAGRTLDGEFIPIKDRFCVTTKYDDFGYNIAATFSRAASSFIGMPLIRVGIKSDKKINECRVVNQYSRFHAFSDLPDLKRDILLSAAQHIIEKRWMECDSCPNPTVEDALKGMMIHAHGEEAVVGTLKYLNAKERRLGHHNNVMYCGESVLSGINNPHIFTPPSGYSPEPFIVLKAHTPSHRQKHANNSLVGPAGAMQFRAATF